MSAVICNITDTVGLIKYRIACHNQNGKVTTGSTGNYTGHRVGMFVPGGVGLLKEVYMTTLGVFDIFSLCRKYSICQWYLSFV